MKNSAKITLEKNGLAKVSGVLSFDTVNRLRLMGDQLLDTTRSFNFDFQQVTRCDSSGLALLTAWTRIARQSDKKVEFSHLPEQLIDIAKVGGLDKILPISTKIHSPPHDYEKGSFPSPVIGRGARGEGRGCT